ncbi:YHS domain-containing protein [bacterium]|nr:YHS domain-containing protein [bacterium]
MHDPVCGKRMNLNKKPYAVVAYKGQRYFLCCPLCQAAFEREPEKYVAALRRKIRRS